MILYRILMRLFLQFSMRKSRLFSKVEKQLTGDKELCYSLNRKGHITGYFAKTKQG